ncbi:MAG TPA: thioredoxin family protein, partial [Albitalea sp.]|nr:thioredoxin family protein [Albitalea sp.]
MTTMNQRYTRNEPTRTELDAWSGLTLVEFGTDWCGYCLAAQAPIAAALAQHPPLRHLKIEDGPGRPLGRSFRVKLWPTLIFIRDGHEVARLVRPRDAQAISQALAQQAQAAQ